MVWTCKSCGTKNLTDETCPYCGAPRTPSSPPAVSTSRNDDASIPGCLAIFVLIGYLVTAIASGGQSAFPIPKYMGYVYLVVGVVVVVFVVLFLIASLAGGR